MKKIILVAVMFFAINSIISAQNVGIGTTTPNASALLDVTATNKGILVPRVTNAQMIAIATPGNGLLVYNTDSVAFAYRAGAAWVFLKGNTTASNDWSTNGNAGTDVTKNFIGTTDNVDMVFKINNKLAGFLSDSRRNTSWGVGAFNPLSLGLFNTATGYQSLANITLGNNNTSNGYQSLFNNLGGTANVATGYQSLYSNQFGHNNTSSGASALYSNSMGFSNVAIGVSALYNNTVKNNLVAIGDSALFNNGTDLHNDIDAKYNTAVGSKAMYNNSVGYGNTAVGFESLKDNIDGANNTSAGGYSMHASNSGSSNSAFGFNTLVKNNGYENSAVGANALSNNTAGNYNTAIGGEAMFLSPSGDSNTAVGVKAGYHNVGSGNVFIGHRAGLNETGSNKLYITNTATDSSTTLLYGEFDNKLLQVNGRLKVNVPETTVGLDLGAAAIKVSGTNPAVFTITATAAALDLVIPNTSMANSPTDILIITHSLNFNKGMAPGVFWNGTNWLIFLESGTPHVVGEKFNVMVIKQ